MLGANSGALNIFITYAGNSLFAETGCSYDLSKFKIFALFPFIIALFILLINS